MLRDQLAGLNTIVPTQGVRTFTNMINGVRSFAVRIRARAQVVVAGGITSVRNRGSAFALFDEVGVSENGVDKVNLDGRMLRFLSEMHAPSALSASRMALANGTYNLEETAVIWFAHPLAASPVETAFIEADPRQALQVFAKYNGDSARLGAAGAGTITITPGSVSLTVQQIYDDQRSQLPLLLPYHRQIVQPITATVTDFPIYLKTSRYVRAIAIQQDTDGAGEVSDILSSLALRGDFRDIIGPQKVAQDDLVYGSELEFGGAVSDGGGLGVSGAVREGYLGINFQRNGRLSNILNPNTDVNLRLEVNAAVSVTVGATASKLRISLLELEEVQGLTVPAESRGFNF